MNSPILRIFVTTSHISTVYMTMLARATHQSHHTDILTTDTGIRRKELLTLIKETAELHSWALVHDFSDAAGEAYDFNPSPLRRFIRKAKTWPIIRQFYDLSLSRYMKKRDQLYQAEIRKAFSKYTEGKKVELYMMTRTYLNRPLKLLFPEAPIFYMEHGIGDYYYVLHHDTPPGKMYGVFSEPYRNYLIKEKKDASWVLDLPGKENFPAFAAELLKKHHDTLDAGRLPQPGKPVVFVLLEAVDMYNVDDSFWTAYLEHILKEIPNPNDYFFLLKPHPMHSKHSIEKTEAYFRKQGLEYALLGNEKLSSAAAEVLFSRWEKNTEYVFCLFSSGCFYLSQLYRDPRIKYYYSTEFMSRYIDNAPPEYYKLYLEMRPIIDQVLAERCRPY